MTIRNYTDKIQPLNDKFDKCINCVKKYKNVMTINTFSFSRYNNKKHEFNIQ